jgi:hypothetical protein
MYRYIFACAYVFLYMYMYMYVHICMHMTPCYSWVSDETRLYTFTYNHIHMYMHRHTNTLDKPLQAYYSKAVHYTLLVTAASFIQVLLLVRQIEYTNSTNAANKVSLFTIGHQVHALLQLSHIL